MNITNHHVSILITMLNQFSKFDGELFMVRVVEIIFRSATSDSIMYKFANSKQYTMQQSAVQQRIQTIDEETESGMSNSGYTMDV